MNATNTGMWLNSGELSFSVFGNESLKISATRISAKTLPIQDVATPTLTTDAATKGYVDNLLTAHVLGTTTGVNLKTVGVTTIYTVPSGKQHIITNIIVIAKTYTSGATPIDPIVSFGNTAGAANDVVATTTLTWGGPSGAADQAVYVIPDNGAITPNAPDTIGIKILSGASGSFSALTADVYIMGIEI